MGFQTREAARPLLTLSVSYVLTIAASQVPHLADAHIERVKGAIVRLEPGPGDEQGAIERAEDLLREWGAVRVKRLPRLTADAPVVQSTAPVAPDASVREVVLEMVDEANVPEREVLRDAVERALDKAGAA